MSVKDKAAALGVAKKAREMKLRREAAQSVAGPQHGKVMPGAVEVEPEAGIGETMAHQGLQGASYGFGDELVGAIGAGAEALGLRAGDSEVEGGGGVDVAGQMEGPLGRIASAYRAERDAERATVKKTMADNPKAAMLAQVLGGIAAPRLPGMASSKGLKGVDFGLNAMKSGAIGGAAYGAGTSEDALPVGDALLGGAIGGGTGLMTASVVNRLRPYLARSAEERAFKALDPYEKSAAPLRKASPIGDPNREARALGRRALDERMVRPFDTSENIAQRSDVARREAGESIQTTIERLQDETKGMTAAGGIEGAPVNLVNVARRLEAKAAKMDLDPTQASAAKALRSEAAAINSAVEKRIESGASVYETLPGAESLKRSKAGEVKPMDWATGEGTAGAQAKMEHSRAYRQAVEDAIEELAGPKERESFKALKDRYGAVSDIAETAGYGSGRQARNNWLSLGDQQLAQTGAAAGGLSQAALLAMLNKLWRERGSSTAAVAFDKMAKGSGDSVTKGATSLTADEDKRQALLRKLASLLE